MCLHSYHYISIKIPLNSGPNLNGNLQKHFAKTFLNMFFFLFQKKKKTQHLFWFLNGAKRQLSEEILWFKNLQNLQYLDLNEGYVHKYLSLMLMYKDFI